MRESMSCSSPGADSFQNPSPQPPPRGGEGEKDSSDLLPRGAGRATPLVPLLLPLSASGRGLGGGVLQTGRATWFVIRPGGGSGVGLWPSPAAVARSPPTVPRHSTGRHAVAAPPRCPLPTRTSRSP